MLLPDTPTTCLMAGTLIAALWLAGLWATFFHFRSPMAEERE